MKCIEIVLRGNLRDSGYFSGLVTIGDSESKPCFFLPLEEIFDVSQFLIEGYDVQVRYIFDDSSEDYVLELGLAEGDDD